jgi:hypothetical protein
MVQLALTQLAPAVTFDLDALLARLGDAHRALSWTVRTLPESWHHRPPGGLVVGCDDGTWSVAQNLAHLIVYEEEVTLVALEALLHGGKGFGRMSPRDPGFLLRWEHLSTEPIAFLLDRLGTTRQSLGLLARAFEPEAFTTDPHPDHAVDYVLDRHTPGWVIAKAAQHTWEHTVSVMRVALYAPTLP